MMKLNVTKISLMALSITVKMLIVIILSFVLCVIFLNGMVPRQGLKVKLNRLREKLNG
jgi:hypothetical protein